MIIIAKKIKTLSIIDIVPRGEYLKSF